MTLPVHQLVVGHQLLVGMKSEVEKTEFLVCKYYFLRSHIMVSIFPGSRTGGPRVRWGRVCEANYVRDGIFKVSGMDLD